MKQIKRRITRKVETTESGRINSERNNVVERSRETKVMTVVRDKKWKVCPEVTIGFEVKEVNRAKIDRRIVRNDT